MADSNDVATKCRYAAEVAAEDHEFDLSGTLIEAAIEIERLRSNVSKITFCYQFGYHDKPFIHGVRNGKDVWLRDDGFWTEDESDARIGLAVALSFYPAGGDWHGDRADQSEGG